MEKNLEEIEIIKNMPLAFAELEMIYDEKGLAIDYKYLNVNDKFSKLTGWEKEDIENKLVTEVYPDVHHNRILYYQQLFEGKEFLDYNSYFPKKNSWYHIKAYKTKRNTFITLFYDVSKLKKANQKLQYMLTHHKYSKILNYEGLMQRLKIFKNINNAICFVITIKNTDNIHSFHGFEFLNNLYKQIVDEFKSYYEGVHLVAHTSYNQIILLIMNPSEKELEKLFSYAKFNIYKSYLVNNYEINIKKNIGYALLKENNTLEMLIQNASVANIFASASEHSQLVEYNEALEEKAIENAKITQSLYRAIKEDNIEIYFQKIVDSKTGKTEYVEALSRCVCKDLGFISPEVLFGMALKSGMNDLLDEYIIEKTFRIFSKYKKRNDFEEGVKLCINLSEFSLYKENIEEMILNSTSYYNLIPEEVCLEISENTFVRDMDHCIKIIEKLKSHNYIIAIDDFGSKYSSIGILYKIPFDILKTDGIFAKNIENKQIYELLETITKIVLESNKEIVIERVETIKEANIFNVLGRFLHQGYYYHKPEKIVKNQKKD